MSESSIASAEPSRSSGYYRARVDILWGNRRLCEIMAAADLGLTGAGVHELITIDYKPGEPVDEARVRRAMDKMVAESERAKETFKILSYKVEGVEFVTKAAA